MSDSINLSIAIEKPLNLGVKESPQTNDMPFDNYYTKDEINNLLENQKDNYSIEELNMFENILFGV